MKREDDYCALFISTFPPRECGIATFTQDLTDAIDKQFFPTIKTRILALNKNGANIYNYPKKVILQISDNDISDYIAVAKKINSMKNIKLICIQHEFGLFGGEYGEYLIAFLELVKKPVMITFHSVLPSPGNKLKVVVQSIASRVKTIIVMTDKAVEILRKDYGISTPIKVLPHGIPNVTFEKQEKEKRNLHLINKTVLSSFGMVSCNKGYEHVIEALPSLVKKFPNLIYLIVGETHPVVRKHEGEVYRNMLERRVKELGLQKHVKFYNKYLTKKEIIQYLKATDIYLSPSLTPEQITSGTLVYAMGCGRAVVSTPFLHAKDIVNPERGILVEFRNPKSFAEAIERILNDKDAKERMEKNSYAYTRSMVWHNTAISYVKLFNGAFNLPDVYFTNIPRINVNHLKKLTDNFGIIQFANYNTPDGDSGYTLDDNARALMVCGALYERLRGKNKLNLMKIYLDYIKYVQQDDGRFYNYVDKNRNVDRESWSEEAHGRAIRALGYLLSLHGISGEIKSEAENILMKSLDVIPELKHQRAIASVIVGLYYYNKEKYSELNLERIKTLADTLVRLYRANSREGWNWFEPIMTYSNAKLSEALMYAYIATQNKEYLNVAGESFDFLIDKTFIKKTFVPVGQNGWYDGDKNKRAYFDQQPIEAASMMNALSVAYQVFGDSKYKEFALSAFGWFLGKNVSNSFVYNEETGGCHDGLGRVVVNMNQGAESTLAYLMARLTLDETV